MFEATFEKAELFCDVINAIAPLVTEISMRASAKGIEVQQMDSAHVALVELALMPGCFAHYRCDHSLEMAMNVRDLQRIVKMIPKTSELTLKNYENPKKAELEFHFDCGYDAIASLMLINLDQEVLGIPETDYSIRIDAERATFHQLFANLGTNGDTSKFEVEDGGLVVTAKGEGGSFVARLDGSKREGAVVVTRLNPIPPLEFSLKYLNKMTTASFCERVLFDINAETPARITFVIDGEEGPSGALRFYLAPKVSDE